LRRKEPINEVTFEIEYLNHRSGIFVRAFVDARVSVAVELAHEAE